MAYTETGKCRPSSPSDDIWDRSSHRRLSRRVCGLLPTLLLVLMLMPCAALAQRGVSISYLPDPGASLTVAEAASADRAANYQGYVPSFTAFSQLPESFTGAVWLRFAFDAAFEKPAKALRIDLGPRLPGTAQLFIPRPDGTFTIMENSPPQGVFTLTDTVSLPDILYARLDGTPGLWFRPVLGQAEDSQPAWPVSWLLAGCFGLAILCSLVQYARRAEEWRVWAIITAGCGIAAALVPSTPAAGSTLSFLTVAGMLMPGLTFLFFVHTTRHVFTTPKTMPGYDAYLIVLYLVAAAGTLLPLAPGFLRTARYLPFMGMTLLLLFPVSMAAMTRSLRGSSVYFVAVLLPVVGVAISTWELTTPDVPLLAETGGMWGLALALLLLAFMSPAQPNAETAGEEDVFDSLNRSAGTEPGDPLAITDLPQATPPYDADEPESLAPDSETSPAPLAEPQRQEDAPVLAQDSDVPVADSTPISSADTPVLLIPDEALTPVARFRHAEDEGTAPDETATDAVPPVALGAALPLVPVISLADTDTGEDDITAEDLPVAERADSAPDQEGRTRLFDLPLLVKNVYDTIAPLAEAKNLGLTWFIAPQTGRLFEGDAHLLESALRFALHDMVQGAEKGTVRLNIRRLPDSSDPGHLAFILVAWDGKGTAHDRTIAGLAEAWMLAEKTGGIFSVEHSPASGTTIIFSAVFNAVGHADRAEPVSVADDSAASFVKADTDAHVPVLHDAPDIVIPADETLSVAVLPVRPADNADETDDERETERNERRIIVADIAASSRAKTAEIFTATAYAVMECATPQDACALYLRHPSALLIMNADMPEVDIVKAIQCIHADDAAHGRSPAGFIALVGYEAQAERMMQAGATRCILKSSLEKELLPCVAQLLPIASPGREDEGPVREQTPEKRLDKSLEHIPPIGRAPDTGELPPESGLFASILPEPGPDAPCREDTGTARPAAHAHATQSGLDWGSGLLDMIITDEAETIGDTVLQPAPHPVTLQEPAGPGTTAARGQEGPQGHGLQEPAGPGTTAAEGPAGIREFALQEPTGPEVTATHIVGDDSEIRLQESAGPEVAATADARGIADETPEPVSAPTVAAGDEADETVLPPPAAPPAPAVPLASRTFVRPRKPGRAAVKAVKRPFASLLHTDTPVRPADAASVPSASPSHSPVGNARDMLPEDTQTAAISIPVPGEDDSIFKDMLPLIPGLLAELSDDMADAMRGKAEKSPLLVQEAAERIAGKAESFGLARLERMARCVERAAAADDIEPMECVLADLAAWVARYKDALVTLHRETMQ